MLRFATAYAAAGIAFFAADFIWLSLASSRFYRPRLGALLSDTPNLTVAGAFYLLYVVGIVVFAIYPAADSRSVWMLVGRALLLGAVAYGTYDITSLSTIRGWPAAVSVVDIAWGMTATTLGSLVGYAALRLLDA
jgi:uncharacterized membrane protein